MGELVEKLLLYKLELPERTKNLISMEILPKLKIYGKIENLNSFINFIIYGNICLIFYLYPKGFIVFIN